MAAALLTPMFMGLTPIFGKLAIRSGLDAYTLAALRTCLAALFLWVFFLFFSRRYIFIFPAGLIGTFIVGAVNGLGSLLYYNGLLLLDNASLAQLLNMTYVIFVMLLTRLYGQRISRMSIARAGMALAAVYLLAAGSPGGGSVHRLGVGLMLGGALMYGLHVVFSQRVMFEMPAPTMALYALTFMGLTVLAARLLVGSIIPLGWTPLLPRGWWFVLGLTAVTALSRVTLFAGVRSLGSLQTALLNMAEAGVTLLAAFFWLGERMTLVQWGGVCVLSASVFLARWDSDMGDLAYRPLMTPRPFGGILLDKGIPVPTRLYRLYAHLVGRRHPPRPVDVSDIMRQFPNLPDLSQFPELADLELGEIPDRDRSSQL
jgi:drug/metabolite transporter (DMT)-like permease